jgi:hypothetical protein
MGNIDEARSYYNQALEIDPDSINIEEKLSQ